MAGSAGIRAGRAFVEVGTDDSQFTAGLNRAQRRLRAFGESVKASGRSMLMASAAAAAPLALGVKVFAGFEQRMARVQALTGASGTAFEQLEQEARRLGETTVYSASQAADAMSFFALAGYDVQKILKSTAPTLNLAAAGQLDIAQAADIAAKIMAGMGLEADDLGYAVDVLAKAMTTANTDLAQLGDAMKFVGPIAKSAGIAFEEVVASVQLLSNAGIQAEMAGTTLRGMILSLSSPSKEAGEQLASLGVSVNDAQGNMRPLADILDQLNRGLAGMGSGQKLNVLGRIFDARQAAGAAELLSQGATKLRQFTSALREAGGTADRIAAVQLDTLQGNATILLSVLQELGISVGEALVGPLRAAADVAIRLVGVIAGWVKQNRALVVGLAAAIAAVGALGGALFAVGTATKVVAFGLGGVATTLSVVRTAMLATAIASKAMWAAFAANPVGLGLTAIAAVVGAIAVAMASARREAVQFLNVMKMTRETGDAQREIDQQRIARLDKLTKQQKLSANEMAEADALLKALKERYGEFGVSLDSTSQHLVVATDAFTKLAEAMRQVADVQLEQEINEIKRNIRAVTDELHDAGAFVGTGEIGAPVFRLARWLTGVPEGTDLVAKREDLFRDLSDLTARRRALRSGDLSALTEGGPAAGPAGATPLAEALAPDEANAAGESRRVQQLRLEAIEDEHARAIALLTERYDYEVAQAEAAGRPIAEIQKARLLEFAKLERDFYQKRKAEEIRTDAEIGQLRVGRIEDGLQRELAAIELRYDTERRLAELSGDTDRLPGLARIRDAEIEAAQAEEAQRLREQAADRAATIAELELRTKFKGIELERQLLELERQRALAAAKAAGENLADVEREFDLRRQLLDNAAAVDGRAPVAGTFSAREAEALGPSDLMQRMLRVEEEQRDLLKRVANRQDAEW